MTSESQQESVESPFDATCESPILSLPRTKWDEHLPTIQLLLKESEQWTPVRYKCPGRVKAWEGLRTEAVPRQRANAFHKSVQHIGTPRVYPFFGLECFFLGTVVGTLGMIISGTTSLYIDEVRLYGQLNGKEVTHRIYAMTAWFGHSLFTTTRGGDDNLAFLQRQLIDQLSQFAVVNVRAATKLGGVSCMCFVLRIDNDGSLCLLCPDATLALLRSLAATEDINWGSLLFYQVTLKRSQRVVAYVRPNEEPEHGEYIPWREVTWTASRQTQMEQLRAGLGLELRYFGIFFPLLERACRNRPSIPISPSLETKQSRPYWASSSFGYFASSCLHCSNLTSGCNTVRRRTTTGAEWCAHGMTYLSDSECAKYYLDSSVVDQVFAAAGNPARLCIFTCKKKFPPNKKIYTGLVELNGSILKDGLQRTTSLEELNEGAGAAVRLIDFKSPTPSLDASFKKPEMYLQNFVPSGSKPEPSDAVWNFAFAGCDCVHTLPRNWAVTRTHEGALNWKDLALGSAVRVYKTFVPAGAQLCSTLDDILAAKEAGCVPIVLVGDTDEKNGAYGVRFAVQKYGGYCYYMRECAHCAVVRARRLARTANFVVLLATNNRRGDRSTPSRGV